MSLECPCIYYKPDGICAKYSGNGSLSYCVQGPCPDETPSNADIIRRMSDEELAKHLWSKLGCPDGRNHVTCGYVGECKDCWLEWLQHPAEQDAFSHTTP